MSWLGNRHSKHVSHRKNYLKKKLINREPLIENKDMRIFWVGKMLAQIEINVESERMNLIQVYSEGYFRTSNTKMICQSELSTITSVFRVVWHLRTQGNNLMVFQGRLRLGIWKNFFIEKVIEHWKRLPREVAESPSLEIFLSCVDIALRDVV